jgi:hypothetical protein
VTDSATGAARPLDSTGVTAAALTAMAGSRPGPAGPPPPHRSRAARPGSRVQAGRARRSAGGGPSAQLPYIIVLAGVVAGLTWIWQGQQYVRAGTFTVAGALFVAVLARLTLPEQRAGMLASRRRYIDVTALAILAVGLLVAGLVLPTPS